MMLGDYTDLSAQPLFAFGHGLSYARFEYEELSAPDTVDVHASINVWVVVRNVSQRDGDEVVQVYAFDKVADVARVVLEDEVEVPGLGAETAAGDLDEEQSELILDDEAAEEE